MSKKIMRYLKNNNGDAYIEALIALMGVVIIFALLFQISSAMIDKMYIDNKLTNISKIVSMNGGWIDPVTGDIRSDIAAIEGEIEGRIGEGGNLTFTPAVKYNYGPDKYSSYGHGPDGFVQIGETVTINYEYEDYPVISISDDKFTIDIDIDISKTAVGEIYHKGLS